MDQDVGHVLSSVSVVLESRYHGDFISVESAVVDDATDIVLSANETAIHLTGSATATIYQVRWTFACIS